MVRFSALLAIGFAIFLAIGEAVRNWGDWQWWPFWLVDYIAATLMLTGGLFVLKRDDATVLVGAWGFTCAMFYMSFFSHIYEIQKGQLGSYGPQGSINEHTLTILIGILLLVSIIGFVMSLAGKQYR
ncbi:MAG: hypothetical protein AAFW83_13320 [Pseudomonadota bacterium]